jgi:hypothetical protein
MSSDIISVIKQYGSLNSFSRWLDENPDAASILRGGQNMTFLLPLNGDYSNLLTGEVLQTHMLQGIWDFESQEPDSWLYINNFQDDAILVHIEPGADPFTISAKGGLNVTSFSAPQGPFGVSS